MGERDCLVDASTIGAARKMVVNDRAGPGRIARFAMTSHHEPLASVVRRSSIGVVVDVQAVSEWTNEGHWKSVIFTARPVEVIFGEMSEGGILSCRYSQGVPHARGPLHVWPSVTGSGLELGVEPGNRIVFLLESEAGGLAPLTLLRAEPLASIELLRRLDEGRGPPAMRS